MDLIVWSITIVSLVLEIVFVIGLLLGKLSLFFFFFSFPVTVCLWSCEGEKKDKDINGVGVRE